MLNATKTWKTTIIYIGRSINSYLKENCFLPYFSRTCTAKAKSVVLKNKLRLLQYSWILNQVGPGGGEYHNIAAPTAKSVKNTYARPARIS